MVGPHIGTPHYSGNAGPSSSGGSSNSSSSSSGGSSSNKPHIGTPVYSGNAGPSTTNTPSSSSQGNFQSVTGEVYQVDYVTSGSREQYIAGTKIPKTGMTDALAQKGFFGSVGGYSTPQGETNYYQVFGSGPKQEQKIPSTKDFISTEKQRFKRAFSIKSDANRFEVESAQSTVLMAPVRVAGFAVAKGAESLRPYELPGFAGNIQDKGLTIVSSQGREAYFKPEKTTLVTVASYGAGEILGAAGGKVVSYFGSKYPAIVGKALPFVEAGVGAGVGGVGAYQAYTDPEGVGKNLVPSIAFGAGAFKGYRVTNPQPTVEYSFGKVTGITGKNYGDGSSFFEMNGQGRVTVKYTQFGETTIKRPKYFVDLKGSPGTGLQAARGDVSVFASSRVEPFSINGRTMSFGTEFAGVLRPPVAPNFDFPGGRAGVLALRSGSRVVQTEYYPTSMFSKTNSDTGSLAFRSSDFFIRGRGALLSNVIEGSSLLESGASSSRVRFSPGRLGDRFNIYRVGSVQVVKDPGLFSTPFRSSELGGRSLRVRAIASDAFLYEPSRNTRGFGLLRQYGQFSESTAGRISNRVGEFKESFNDALFPRRQKRLYSGLMFEGQRSRYPSTILEPPSTRGRGLPPLDGIRPTVFGFGQTTGLIAIPAFGFGKATRGGVVRPATQFSTATSFKPIQDVVPVYRQVTTQGTSGLFKTVQAPSFDFTSPTDGGFSNVVGPSPPPPPPVFPPIGGFIPPFFGAPGGKGVEGRGRGRGFKYAPSFNALLLGIKGKRPTGPLSGFETRPLIGRMR